MFSFLIRTLQLHQLITALLVIIALLIGDSIADTESEQTKAERGFDPFHFSWKSKGERYDFVYNTHGTIKNVIKLESDPSNYLTNSLSHCTNHSACLFKNGTFLEAFQVVNETPHESVYNPIKATQNGNKTTSLDKCDTENTVKIVHYCSTHWNPPHYWDHYGCTHLINWHSPLTCHSNATNQERPCHIYDPSGELIDLTSWVLSDGSSYSIDTGNTTIKKFNLNVCNEAHDPCGPNVAACSIDEHHNIVENGYNNLTSIKLDAQDRTVLLTTWGHFKEQCDDRRIKTVIRFVCKNKIFPNTKPRLVRSTGCESIVEWPTVHACPVFDIRIPETDCKIQYKPLGIDIDIRNLTNKQTLIEIPDIRVKGGQARKMILGICQGVPKTFRCEGKLNSNTKACLVDAGVGPRSKTADNSLIVGSVSESYIRLADDKIFLETRALNHTCSENVQSHFNITQQIGTRIEFFCANTTVETPTFLRYDDCTYVFEWGSPQMCLEVFERNTTTTVAQNKTKSSLPKDLSKHLSNIDLKNLARSESEQIEIRNNPAKKQDEKQQPTKVPPKELSNQKVSNKQPKTNGAHALFMISLIILFFSAFIIVIFVLDKRTRLRVTLRQARQVFQSNNQQPYSRVIDDLDL